MSKRPSFFEWFRVGPIILMAVAFFVCIILYETETTFSKSIFYPVHYGDMIEESAERHGVDPYLACAIIKCESDWDEWAMSNVGAVGLMQVMPSSAQTMADWGSVDPIEYPVADLEVPRINIEYGCAMLAYLSSELNSTEEVVAAYNAGLGNVQDWTKGGADIASAITYPETAAYLEKVMNALEGYRTSYPVGITDRSSTANDR